MTSHTAEPITERRTGRPAGPAGLARFLPPSFPAMLTTLCGISAALTYWRIVRFSTFTSDAANYWSDSVHWREPFNQYHMPGFPILIAVARGATGDVVGRTGLMTCITVAALLLGVHATFTLASLVGLSRRVAMAAAGSYGLWPFVGATYAAFPVSDPIALSALLWGTVFLLRRQPVLSGLCLGLAAVTHKALWPAVGLLVVGQILVPDRRRSGAITGAIAAAPLAVLWVTAVLSGHPAAWLLSASAEDAAQPLGHRSLHLLDGLIGSVLYGDWVGRLRVVVVAGVLLLAVPLLAKHIRRWQHPAHLVATVFAGQIIFMALTLNQHLIWASVRFSGLLAVPTACLLSPAIDRCDAPRWRHLQWMIVIGLIATQVLTAAEGARRGWGGTL